MQSNRTKESHRKIKREETLCLVSYFSALRKCDALCANLKEKYLIFGALFYPTAAAAAHKIVQKTNLLFHQSHTDETERKKRQQFDPEKEMRLRR